LFEGEEMNADMANFIGIHMLNDLIDPHDDVSVINDEEDENQIHDKSTAAQYVDPVTGAHFEYNDFVKRVFQLQQRRAVIDRAIEEGE
jgi:hypothetical protein